MSFQVRVLNSRFTAGDQRISHAQDDESSTLAGIEDAGAVLEPAGFGTEFANLTVSEIQREHRGDSLGDLLAVCSDILHRRSAHAAGNTAQALDPGTISGDSAGHEPVPLFACPHFE